MNARIRPRVVWLMLFIVAVLPAFVYAGVPEVSDIMVTDVTTRSFSVIWAASEASTANLEVFADENGAVSVADAVITPHPVESGDVQIKTLAENQGVMKVRVCGLEANTIYYFRTITTSKSTLDTTYYPDAAPLMQVVTESLTVRTTGSGDNEVPFSNDIIIEPCYFEDGEEDDEETYARGTLLLATVKGGHHPITAFVGDGIELPYAMIDLNNVFSGDSFENLDLLSGENLTLVNFRGLAGNSIVTHIVPQDQSLSEVKPSEFLLVPGWNMVSTQLNPTIVDVEIVLDPIMNELVLIETYDAEMDDWLKYKKDNIYPWTNDLEEIHVTDGYWLVVDNTTSLQINGSFYNESISLYPGWNLVGYNSIETVKLMDAIAPIYDSFVLIQTYDANTDDWLKYRKDNPYPWTDDLDSIEPGRAYWVVVSDFCEW